MLVSVFVVIEKDSSPVALDEIDARPVRMSRSISCIVGAS
jgi:hypothetical protein